MELKEWSPPLREFTMSIWLITSTLCWLDRPVIQCWWLKWLEITCLPRIRTAGWSFGICRLLRSWRLISGDTPALRLISMSHWINWSVTAEIKLWSWSTWRNLQKRRITCPRTAKLIKLMTMSCTHRWSPLETFSPGGFSTLKAMCFPSTSPKRARRKRSMETRCWNWDTWFER